MSSRRLFLLTSCTAFVAMLPAIGLAVPKTISQIKTEPKAAQLQSLLEDPFYTEFLAFSKKSLMDENVAFLYAVKHKQDSKAIYNRYIAKGGAKQVNLPQPIVEALAKNAAPNKWERMDFKPAETEIAKLLGKQTGGNDIITNFVAEKTKASGVAPAKKAGKK